MARRRLGPPTTHPAAEADRTAPSNRPAPPAGALSAPIAQVAGDAAASAALARLTDEMAAARAEGRLIRALPLDSVVADHLARDRLVPRTDDPDMAELIASLHAHGQRVPIDVTALDDGRFGLVSGWRRLTALRTLHAETGADRFATVRAIVRSPGAAAEAYVAMVEENELRVGLSHYERARIVALAAQRGVFPDERAALSALFAHVSRAKRSKIGSFLALYHALDGHLRFPTAIGERLGLALVQRLESFGADRLIAMLGEARPTTADAERTLLEAVVAAQKPKADPKAAPSPQSAPQSASPAAPPTLPMAPPTAPAPKKVAPGRWLAVERGEGQLHFTVSGRGVEAGDLAERLAKALTEALRARD